ncbi:hypothetical protein J21TS7_41550 [Paenibacillus cineris]|uniref:Uncharacterized protein n=1 Tax=Paenibacillus cineris TaxID=237530 RepID=A0ABQ4LH27_9BACL|nr:hypothetical protein J21TS7_41550 [Paenibacillus cineris]
MEKSFLQLFEMIGPKFITNIHPQNDLISLQTENSASSPFFPRDWIREHVINVRDSGNNKAWTTYP